MSLTVGLVPSLRALCVEAVGEYIISGMYKHKNYRLDIESSNQVLDELSIYEMTDAIEKEIKQKFNATRVVLPHFVHANFRNITLCQRLKQFIVPFIITHDDLRALFKVESDSDKMYVTDIVTLMLSETSQSELLELSVNGSTLAYSNGWISTLSTLLPSLTNLSIPNSKLTDHDFKTICSQYPNLTILDISGSGVTNLDGIHRVVKLEELDLTNLLLETKEDIEDIFNLANLKTLYIAGRQTEPSYSLNRFNQTGKVLPKLKRIDCSYNVLNAEDCKTLETTHRSLETICIFGSNLSRSALPDFMMKELYVGKTQFMSEDLATLNFFTKTRRIDTMLLMSLCCGMANSLVYRLRRQNPNDIDRALLKMIEICNDYRNDSDVLASATYFLQTVSKLRIMADIPVAVRRYLIGNVIRILDYFATDTEISWSRRIRVYTWSVFTNPLVIDVATQSQIDIICYQASESLLIDTELVLPSVIVFGILIEKISDKLLMNFSNNKHLRNKLFHFVSNNTDPIIFMSLLKIFCCLHQKVLVSRRKWTAIVAMLMKSLKIFDQHPPVQLAILRCIFGGPHQLLGNIHRKAFRRFFGSEELSIFGRLFTTRDPMVFDASIDLIVQIWVHHFKKRDPKPGLDIFLRRLGALLGNPVTRRDDDMPFFLELYACAPDPNCELVQPWAKWVFRQYENWFPYRVKGSPR